MYLATSTGEKVFVWRVPAKDLKHFKNIDARFTMSEGDKTKKVRKIEGLAPLSRLQVDSLFGERQRIICTIDKSHTATGLLTASVSPRGQLLEA